MLGVSCDSFDENTNRLIGRHNRARPEADGEQVAHALRVRDWCDEFNIKYKLNTVVNTLGNAV